MKKIITTIVMFLIVATVTACGTTPTATSSNESEDTSKNSIEESSNKENEETVDVENQGEIEAGSVEENANSFWRVAAETDEFGDVKEDGELGLVATTRGDFSNTATSSSELVVNVQVIMMSKEHPVFLFDMYEYGDNPASFLPSEQKTMKIKAEDEISTIYIETFDGFRGVCTGFTQNLNEGYRLHHYLRKGEDVRCIIEIGSSKYNFTLEGANYAEAFNIAFPEEAIPIKDDSATVTLKEAQIGDYINFGKDEDGSSISWKVLDKKDNEILVVSEKFIGQRPFFATYSDDGDWSNSLLRTWLNEDFVQLSFSEEEISVIKESEISSKSGSEIVNTTDKVFLLSCEDAENYFGSDAKRSEGILERWLLRDVVGRHGQKWKTLQMNYVRDNGVIIDYPIHEGEEIGIRPAMWIIIE